MAQTKNTGSIRIIGGLWRGRKLQFPNIQGLRPTTDRNKETLFNWLTPYLAGARCLDLFAGSGSLGLEALSRGASHVDFVELNKKAIANINTMLKTLTCEQANTYHQDALKFLAANQNHYDILFLDPPFQQKLLPQVLEILQKNKRLNNETLLYIEYAQNEQDSIPLENFTWLKQKKAGQVVYGLLSKNE